MKRPVNSAFIIQISESFVKKKCGSRCCRGDRLLLAEGHTVGALVDRGIAFVGTHQDPVKRAVVLTVAVVCALLNGAFDGLVGMTIHNSFPPLQWFRR